MPHTPCLSCVGALAQLRIWAPKLKIRVLYQARATQHETRESHQKTLFGFANRSPKVVTAPCNSQRWAKKWLKKCLPALT